LIEKPGGRGTLRKKNYRKDNNKKGPSTNREGNCEMNSFGLGQVPVGRRCVLVQLRLLRERFLRWLNYSLFYFTEYTPPNY